MKLFFAFYDRSYGYVRAIIALVAGIVLIAWPDTAVKTIIVILGAFLMAVGIVSVVLSNIGKWKTEKTPLLTMNGLVDIVFGLVLVLFPTFFASIIMFLFGLLLLLFGLGELISLFQSRKVTDIPVTFFIAPIITTACGLIIFFNPFSTMEWLFIFFGIVLIFYSITQFVSTYSVRSKIHAIKKEEAKIIQDVPFEEVKSDDETPDTSNL